MSANNELITEQGSWVDFKWWSTSVQGFRTRMTNFTSLNQSLGHLQSFSLFLIFDGNGDVECAYNAAKGYAKFLQSQNFFKSLNDTIHYDPNIMKEMIKRSVWEYDIELSKVTDDIYSGSTMTGVLITPMHLFFINLGNLRTLLAQNGRLEFLTKHHVPSCEAERIRIHRAGGRIMSNYINGRLQVTRSLGNFDMKRNSTLPHTEQIISAEPEVTMIPRKGINDDFIVISNRGINQIISNRELMNLIAHGFTLGKSIKQLTEEIIEHCLGKGSRENLSLIIIKFQNSQSTLENAIISQNNSNRIQK